MTNELLARDDSTYSQGICGDGAAILRDGVMMTIEDIVATLNTRPAASVDAELVNIGKLIATQDNRITDKPIFIVQQKRQIVGIEDDYAEKFVFLKNKFGEYPELDGEELAEAEAYYAENYDTPHGVSRIGYVEVWDFVTACFTEQGCKDYIVREGHNLKKPRIYAAGSYRNNEWQTVRNALIDMHRQAITGTEREG